MTADPNETSALDLAPPLLAGDYPVPRYLDAAMALAYRTPLEEHPPAADGKAAAILTVLGLMLTLLARYHPALWPAPSDRWGFAQFLAVLFIAGFVGFSVAAAVQSFRTISPRFPEARHSLAFFGDIARLSREEYVARVEALTDEEALEQILTYNHTASAICVEKFLHLRIGVRMLRYSFGCWLALMALIAGRMLVHP